MKTFTQKIIAALFAFGCIASAQAQIVYTDVQPDASFKCNKAGCVQNYALDLNNDGVTDFSIVLMSIPPNPGCTGSGFRVSITPLNGNGVAAPNPVTGSSPNAWKYAAAVNVNSLLTWQTAFCGMRSVSQMCCPFVPC